MFDPMTENITTASERKVIAAARQVDPPEGYTEIDLIEPYEALLGPMFEKRLPEPGPDLEGEGNWSYAFYVDERHLNWSDNCHGGMLLSFADAVLGAAAWRCDRTGPCVTLSTQASFLSSGKLGDLVEVRPEIVRKTRDILFVRGDFEVDGLALLTVTSLWKVIGPKN